MAKIKDFKITKTQLDSIVYLADTISSMIGGFDEDFNKEGKKAVKAIDALLNKNGYKRKYN